MEKIDSLTVVKRFLEVAAQHVGLTPADIALVSAVALQVDQGEGEVPRRESNHGAVDSEDDARQGEHKQKEGNVPLHCNAVLKKQSQEVGETWKDQRILLSFLRFFNQVFVNCFQFMLICITDW